MCQCQRVVAAERGLKIAAGKMNGVRPYGALQILCPHCAVKLSHQHIASGRPGSALESPPAACRIFTFSGMQRVSRRTSEGKTTATKTQMLQLMLTYAVSLPCRIPMTMLGLATASALCSVCGKSRILQAPPVRRFLCRHNWCDHTTRNNGNTTER